MKIAIIGYSGSGKSTLARLFSERYGIEVMHMDCVHWLPGWVVRAEEDKQRIVREFLDANESWVIDGNYPKLCYERRLEEADLIVEMLFNRFACYRRAWKRYRTYKGRSRPDMTEGCDEVIDRAFTKWILFTGRTKARRREFSDIAERYPGKTVVIRNQKQLTAYKKKIESGGPAL